MRLEKDIDLVVQTVINVNGCKATELPIHLKEKLLEIDSLTDAIQAAVNQGRLVEVEYVLPHQRYRVKSFLLPAGTEVHHAQNQFN